MTRSLTARLVLTAIAVVVWGYGYRYDDARIRMVAIILLVVTLALRFLPGRWFGDPDKS
jgi:hypothetical protein